MNRTIRNFAALLLALALFWSGSQAQDSLDIKAYYTKAEHMIPDVHFKENKCQFLKSGYSEDHAPMPSGFSPA